MAADTNLRIIAEMARLNDEKAERFIQFIQMWSSQKNLDPSYITEWVERFRKETEYEYADDERLKFLVEIDGVAASRRRMQRVGQKNNWSPEQLDRELGRIDMVTSKTVARKSKQRMPIIDLKPSTATVKRVAKNIMNMAKRPKLKL